MIFDCLTDPNDRIMLALSSKTIAVHFKYLTRIGLMLSPSALGLCPLAARVNAWVGPGKRYCRLCRTVKDTEAAWWTEVATYLSMENRELAVQHRDMFIKLRGLSRFDGLNILKWCAGTVDEPPEARRKTGLLLTFPEEQRKNVVWCSVCPLHATFWQTQPSQPQPPMRSKID